MKRPRPTRAQARAAATTPIVSQGPRPAVIITARNNGPFLREAILSAINQTIRCDVVYSDDASTDGSLKIAADIQREFPGRLTITASRMHTGVCAARNRGAAATTASHLVFLDGDDVLTPTFLTEHLAVMGPTTPFAYGPAEGFGEGPRAGIFWGVPRTWEELDLWRGNSCNTSCMYARWAFDAAGGWQEGIGTMWDWSLALRASRYGRPAASRALLKYRQHAGSWSHSTGEIHDANRAPTQRRLRCSLARVSIGCVLSGRLGQDFLRRWFRAVLKSFAGTQRPDITLLLTGDLTADDAVSAFDPVREGFSGLRLLRSDFRQPSGPETGRRMAVATFLAESMNTLRAAMPGDIHWIIEDDIIVPPYSGNVMVSCLCDGAYQPPGAVTGLYRNRHTPAEFVCGTRSSDFGHFHLRKRPDEPQFVDFAGTGCLMFWKDRTPAVWRPTLNGTPAHDWAWSFDLGQMNRKLVLDPAVACGHARAPGDIIEAT